MGPHAQTRPSGTARTAGVAAIALLGCLLFADPSSGHSVHATPAQSSSDTAGKTTRDQRIVGDPSAAFSFLSLGPGETYTVREEGVGTARRNRHLRRASLLYFGQLTDFQLVDEESPARVEFADTVANPPFPSTVSAAWRPQEALVAHNVELAIRQMNRFLRSPVAQGDKKHARMALALMTGDLADNQHLNETEWVRMLLEGGTLDPSSGSENPAHHAQCPPGTPGPGTARQYHGVQDYDDYAAGNQFYDPDQPVGLWAQWPRYPGLMDRAQAPFASEGLKVPSYITFGNHDGLAQGNQAAIQPFEQTGTGCIKPLVPAQNLSEAFRSLDPVYLQALLGTDPGKAMLVPPDPRRQYVSKQQFKQVFRAGSQADDHGFAFVDREEERVSNGAAAYYSWSPAPRMRLISIDTLSEGGVAGPSANGNIDDPQWRWLKRELEAASKADEIVVLFGHHPIGSLNADVSDETAPPCTGPDDEHGHNFNPGCDPDPRQSRPLHFGEELAELLRATPHAIAYVAGHTHENRITPFAREGGGGFWGIETASLIDWPPQTRTIEVMDNRDGTLSIFGLILDTEAPSAAPPAGTAAGAFGLPELASIGRALSFNDPQAGAGGGDGQVQDRNIELLVADPRRDRGRVPPSRKPRIRLSVSPPVTRPGRLTRYTFRATRLARRNRYPVSGATIAFAGRRARTDRRGRATITTRISRSGSFRARATRQGFLPGRASVTVTRPPRFTG